MSTLKQLLSAAKLLKEEVPLPALGPGVTGWVRTMPCARRDAFDLGAPAEAPLTNFRARTVAFCTCDAEGRFEQETPEQAEEMAVFVGNEVQAIHLRALFEAAARLNGLRDRDLEDPTKNSVDAPGSSSGSGSGSPSENPSQA